MSRNLTPRWLKVLSSTTILNHHRITEYSTVLFPANPLSCMWLVFCRDWARVHTCFQWGRWRSCGDMLLKGRSVRTGKAKKMSWGSGNVRSLEHGYMDKRVEGKAPLHTHSRRHLEVGLGWNLPDKWAVSEEKNKARMLITGHPGALHWVWLWLSPCPLAVLSVTLTFTEDTFRCNQSRYVSLGFPEELEVQWQIPYKKKDREKTQLHRSRKQRREFNAASEGCQQLPANVKKGWAMLPWILKSSRPCQHLDHSLMTA